MCKHCEEVRVASAPLARRNVLKFAGAAAATLALSGAGLEEAFLQLTGGDDEDDA